MMVVRPKVLARWVPWFFGLGLLVAVAMFATHHSNEMAFAQLVLHARPGWLIVIGVPVAAGLAATLLFRFFTFWLPMAPGLILARHEARA